MIGLPGSVGTVEPSLLHCSTYAWFVFGVYSSLNNFQHMLCKRHFNAKMQGWKAKQADWFVPICMHDDCIHEVWVSVFGVLRFMLKSLQWMTKSWKRGVNDGNMHKLMREPIFTYDEICASLPLTFCCLRRSRNFWRSPPILLLTPRIYRLPRCTLIYWHWLEKIMWASITDSYIH